MINLTFEVNGQKVDPNRVGDALERAVYQGVRDSLLKQLQGIRDPETGAPPKITVKGRNLKDLKIEASGSEVVIAEVKRRIQSL